MCSQWLPEAQDNTEPLSRLCFLFCKCLLEVVCKGEEVQKCTDNSAAEQRSSPVPHEGSVNVGLSVTVLPLLVSV